MNRPYHLSCPTLSSSLLILLGLCAPAIAQDAGSPAQAFKLLAADTSISRSIAFSELGFNAPLVLDSAGARREIYLPVPPNVAISAGKVALNANYLRADGGRTTLVLSLDNYPVSARAYALESGDASAALGVDGAPRNSGFVRLGVNWSTALASTSICADASTPGNILRIEPDSRFTYRYDGAAIGDLSTAWGALPATSSILIAGGKLSATSYDTAWRMGVALERAGKRSLIARLPAVGDVISLDANIVPSALRSIPAFAALAQAGKHTIKDNAEIGALMSLGQNGPLRADIIVADPALLAGMRAAFDALRDQITATAPEAAAAYAQWRTRLEPAAKTVAAHAVRLDSAFGRSTILVAPDAGAKAAGLFSQQWRSLALTPALAVQTASAPAFDASVVPLSRLGGAPGSFNVFDRAEWNASFNLAAVSGEGRLPSTLVLDVSAAPGAARAAPVASIFLNDILLGAKHLDANGQRERITARIPHYALASNNVLKVSFVRQLSSNDCRETPQAYPVAVLASSHMQLDKATRDDSSFTGMLSRFADGAELMLPASYLTDARSTLPRVIRLASSTGVSATNATLTLLEAGKEPAPGGSFLALDLPFKSDKNQVKSDAGRIVVTDASQRVLLDMSGLERIGLLEVGQISGQTGISYRTVGATAPALDQPLQLARGNFAAIGARGVLMEIDTDDASGRALIDDANREESWVRAALWWILPTLGVALFIALMVAASRARRRRDAAKHKA
jgi:hypothetical protein